jgi:hypothetical protein
VNFGSEKTAHEKIGNFSRFWEECKGLRLSCRRFLHNQTCMGVLNLVARQGSLFKENSGFAIKTPRLLPETRRFEKSDATPCVA